MHLGINTNNNNNNSDSSHAPLADNSLCRSVGYRSGILGEGEIIFERQDYLLEKLEAAFLYNHSRMGINHPAKVQKRRPDILVLQVGRLSCHDAFASGSNGNRGPTDQEKEQPRNSENMIHSFMKAVKDIVTANRATNDANTTVIVSLASRNHLDNMDSSACTWHMNRIFAFGAHYQGFVVLEREELEYRLMFKSEHSPAPLMTVKAVLDTPPAPQILATSLLSIYACIQANVTFAMP